MREKFQEIKDKFHEKIDELKEKFQELKAKIAEKLESIKTKLQELKAKFVEKLEVLKTKFQEFKDKLIELKDKFIELKDKIIEFKDKLLAKVGDFIQGIKDLPGLLAEKIRGALKIGGGKSSGGNNITSGGGENQDFIQRPGQRATPFSSQDTIIGVKNTGGLGGGGSKVFNFYGVTPQEMMDTIKRELATEVNASSRF